MVRCLRKNLMNFKKYLRWAKGYFAQIPFYTIFYITSRCNARCAHCFNWRLIEDSPNRKELSLEEIEKIAKNWGNMLMINLGGGEPYLRNDIPEIVEIFRKYTGVEIVGVPSNGFLTEKIVATAEELLNRFTDIHFRFTFSIDGLSKTHDKIRGVPGGFKKVIQTAKGVKKLKSKYKNFTLNTNSCFMQNNQDELMDLLKYLKTEIDPDTMGVTYIRGEARLSETQQNLYNQKYKEAIDYLTDLKYDKFKNHPLANFIWGATTLARHKVFENLKTGKRNFECYVIKKMIVIDDMGEVKICEMLPTSLGNLREHDYDIKRIVTSDLAKKEYEKIKKHQCNCTWECAIRTGVMYNPKEYFSILKYFFKK